ncbi:hypothetical protein Q1L34_12835 [Raoultella ornithinolytica]|uniref:hypothetical protein n=1 Tax=Raoultella ornithinolytica TaxID=54291 RepID=UPI0015DCA096|nr:hypothetical protein [Raoultella ornithinolytica]QLK21567.1 hypothetical protein GPJ66_12590 [Raoultella ornithinolytica]WKL86232.1 hypothetical protein Q1L34_12835 [Raoultella ornithinolytica]HAU5005037.1 hypothetical protein [Raoultella ornithinolytica]
MSYSVIPQGDFEYTYEEEEYQVTPEQVGESQKASDRQFKDDTETWEYVFAATLVDGSYVTWLVTVEVGDTPYHDVNSSGVQDVPEEIKVIHDPDFECLSNDDDDDY